jgi:hypothetical protein
MRMMSAVNTLFYFVLFFASGCESTENEQETVQNKPFMEIFEKFDIYNGTIKNGWGGYIMVAMDGSV